jgi:hypothetical protein
MVLVQLNQHVLWLTSPGGAGNGEPKKAVVIDLHKSCCLNITCFKCLKSLFVEATGWTHLDTRPKKPGAVCANIPSLFAHDTCILTTGALTGKPKFTDSGEPVPFNPPTPLYGIMSRNGIQMWATARKRRCAFPPSFSV